MAPVGPKSSPTGPWVENHKPKHLGQVVGNTDQVRKLAEWLRDWDDVCLHGKVKEVVEKKEEWRKFQPAPENINARAALISGPPGIGKTTTCTLVARCNPKYTLMEYNASDARSKSMIDQMSQSLGGNHTLSLKSFGKSLERAVIIMDECDGMAGGGDKGGMQALINMIKVAKNPIICICNDRSDAQVRNLAAVCLDLRFKKPENAVVAKRIKSILEGMGQKQEITTIESIVEACGQDIRQVLNHCQMYGSSSTPGSGSGKETSSMMTPFDACSRLLSGGAQGNKKTSMMKKLDMFYIDQDLMPLMIQENYLRTYEKRGHQNVVDDLATCAKAAEMIAMGDSLATQSSFEAGSSVAVVGTIYPSFLTAGEETFVRPSFPSWLMKRKDVNKGNSLVQDMHTRIKAATTTSKRDLVTSNYHDVLHRRLLKPLQLGAVKECASALFSYGLAREFFTDMAPALRKPLQLDDPYQKLEGKAKHQLLEELKTLNQALQVQQGIKRKQMLGGGSNFKAGDAGADGDAAAGDRKRKATARKAKADGGGFSLSSWNVKRKAEAVSEANSSAGNLPKKPLLILKFIEGHTNAVRRRLTIEDLLKPWKGY